MPEAPSIKEAFVQYRRKEIAELRPWKLGDHMADVSISGSDYDAGSPKDGDMIARNPKNHADQWLVAAAYFADNFEPLATFQPDGERREAIARAIAAYNEVWNGWPELEAKNVDECREEAMKAALLASGLVQDEAGWRDISTAPKDGTEIWAYNGEQARMKFFDADPTEEGYSLWVWTDDLMNDVDPAPEPPTHWMPLPTPPIRSARDGGES